MTTVLIEYTGHPAHGETPVRRAGKFVQIRHGSTEFLVFSPKDLTPYHADIVHRFCNERDIAGTYDRNRKRFDIDAPGWAVAGGGKFEIDAEGKRLRLYDNSMAYGRFDGKGLREAIERSDTFFGYDVIIEQ